MSATPPEVPRERGSYPKGVARRQEILDRVPALAGTRLLSDEFAHVFSYRPNGRVVGDGQDDLTGEFAFCDAGAEVAGRVVAIGPSGLPVLLEARRNGTPARCPTA